MATPEELSKLQSVVPAAQASARRWGVPASVTLAQWITESTWGTSQLAVEANNYFGIKASTFTAMEGYVEFSTWEYEGGQKVLVKALFAKFGNEAACFDVHARLLATAARYRQAMASADHPKVFAVALQSAGYSTSAHYATDLLTLMRQHNLTQYDVAPAVPAQAGPQLVAATATPAKETT